MYGTPIIKWNLQQCACDVMLTFKHDILYQTIFDQVNCKRQNDLFINTTYPFHEFKYLCLLILDYRNLKTIMPVT